MVSKRRVIVYSLLVDQAITRSNACNRKSKGMIMKFFARAVNPLKCLGVGADQSRKKRDAIEYCGIHLADMTYPVSDRILRMTYCTSQKMFASTIYRPQGQVQNVAQLTVVSRDRCT